MTSNPTMVVGDKVKLTHEVWRYPHFIAPAGATGTVVDVGAPDIFAVRMDEHIPGAEDWENEIHWSIDFDEDPTKDLVRVQ